MTRYHAAFNPHAQERDPLTVDHVVTSPRRHPLHNLDCCVRSDGGAACWSRPRSAPVDLPLAPVYVLGAGEHLASPQ